MRNKKLLNMNIVLLLALIAVGLAAVSSGCSSDTGEESGTALTLSEKYDKVRNGARLILAYDVQSNSFKGMVVTVRPMMASRARPLKLTAQGKEVKVEGVSLCSHLRERKVSERMVGAFTDALKAKAARRVYCTH